MIGCINLSNVHKKVLIISRDFIPYCETLGGAIRVLKMAEFFLENNIDVYIIAAKGEKINYFGYENLIKNMKVIYIDDPLQKYITENFNKTRLLNASNDKYLFTNLRNNLKKVINEFSIPDAGVFFIRKFLKTALKLISDEHIKNVIVSSPPHSSQLLGLIIKKILGSNICYIVDYRDSWNCGGLFSKHTYLTKKLSEIFEQNVLKTCDYFLYVSLPILQKINLKFFDITSKSLLVMNGFDIKMADKRRCRNNTQKNNLTMGYFGSIGRERNPESLFRAILKVNKEIKLIFYTHNPIDHIWTDKLEGILEAKDAVDHQTALNMMRKMDVLLLIHSEVDGADEVITGKFFEYLLAEKPIFVVGPKTMEVVRMIKERQLGYYADINDEEDILNTLYRIYIDWQNNELFSYSLEDVGDLSRQHQYSKILDILI